MTQSAADPEVHRKQLEIYARMSPQQKLEKVFELSEMTRELFRAGLKQRFPDLSPEELHKLYLERLALCHNQHW